MTRRYPDNSDILRVFTAGVWPDLLHRLGLSLRLAATVCGKLYPGLVRPRASSVLGIVTGSSWSRFHNVLSVCHVGIPRTYRVPSQLQLPVYRVVPTRSQTQGIPAAHEETLRSTKLHTLQQTLYNNSHFVLAPSDIQCSRLEPLH